VKPNFDSDEIHPQLSNNGHTVDGALMGVGSWWRNKCGQRSVASEKEPVAQLGKRNGWASFQ
jgi:hypothetical protein